MYTPTYIIDYLKETVNKTIQIINNINQDIPFQYDTKPIVSYVNRDFNFYFRIGYRDVDLYILLFEYDHEKQSLVLTIEINYLKLTLNITNSFSIFIPKLIYLLFNNLPSVFEKRISSRDFYKNYYYINFPYIKYQYKKMIGYMNYRKPYLDKVNKELTQYEIEKFIEFLESNYFSLGFDWCLNKNRRIGSSVRSLCITVMFLNSRTLFKIEINDKEFTIEASEEGVRTILTLISLNYKITNFMNIEKYKFNCINNRYNIFIYLLLKDIKNIYKNMR